eukprot:3476944-Alexandrium_andersonii.AAC.1
MRCVWHVQRGGSSGWGQSAGQLISDAQHWRRHVACTASRRGWGRVTGNVFLSGVSLSLPDARPRCTLAKVSVELC